MSSEIQWRFFRHPDTLAVQRVRNDDEGYIKVLLRWRWEEIEEPEDWDETRLP